jgi:hypothetical protein
MFCKCNYAAYVSINMPHVFIRIVATSIYFTNNGIYISIYIDITICSGLNLYTKTSQLNKGFQNDRTKRQQRSKSRYPYRGWHVKPFRRQGSRSEIPARRVFRPARPDTSQVRDAASRAGGKHFGLQCSQRIWRLPSYVLPRGGEFQGGGDCRSGSPQAWSSRSSQNPERSVVVSQKSNYSRAAHAGTRACRQSTGEIRSRCAPQDYRTSVESKKKHDVSDTAASLSKADWLVSRYESLRTVPLGQILTPECRNGLAIFLHRGMWGWCQTLATMGHTHNPSRSFWPVNVTSNQHTAAIQVLAAIAMDCNHGRKQ